LIQGNPFMSASIALIYAPSKHKLAGMFALPCLGGYLKRQGVDVMLIDAPLLEYDVRTALERLRELDPDVIGVSVPLTQLVYDSVEFMKLVRARFPDKLLISGGIHATLAPEDVAPYCDAVVIGDGELTTLDILERYGNGDDWRATPGICFPGVDGKLLFSEPRALERDLDRLGGPDWSLIPFEQWYDVFHFHIEGEIALPMVSSRGCPFNCTFCANKVLTGRRVRFRSIPSFLDDIETAMEEFGIRSFFFLDDVFTLKKDRVREFADEKRRRNLDFRFITQTRADCVDEEDIRVLKEAGLFALGFGLESADPLIMEKINKKLPLHRVREAMDACRKHEIHSGLTIIIGTPWETFDSLKTTFAFLDEVSPDLIGFCFFIPYPRTESFQEALEIGGLNYLNWADAMSNEPTYAVYRAPGLQGVHPGLIRDAIIWSYYTRSPHRLKHYFEGYSWRGGLPQLARCFRNARVLKKRGLRFR
jgi:radical SAM superfamily enzyme YgiQ (UPF0313 family)